MKTASNTFKARCLNGLPSKEEFLCARSYGIFSFDLFTVSAALFWLFLLTGCGSNSKVQAKPSYVVFTASPRASPSTPQIYIADADGSHIRQLTQEPRGADFATLSPNKALVVYQTPIPYQNNPSQLHSIQPDGSNPRTLISLPDPALADIFTEGPTNPAFSPDGSLIAFFVEEFGAHLLTTIHPDGSHFMRYDFCRQPGLLPTRPVYAPDGRIVYNIYGGIGIANMDGTNARLFIPNPVDNAQSSSPITTAYYQNLTFSPDGTLIVFERTLANTPTFNDNPAENDIMIANADGSNIRLLVQGGYLYYPAFTPDGKQVVYQNETNFRRVYLEVFSDSTIFDSDLRIVNRDGSNSRVFLNNNSAFVNPQHPQFR